MKRISLLIGCLFCVCFISAAPLKSEVNECFELSSIVFRLAGAQEFVNNDIQAYANDIDNYFTEFKGHKLIKFIQDIRQQYAIGYDAVTSAVSQIEIRNGKVMIKEGVNTHDINKIDSRWTKQIFVKFVRLLNDFYRKTKFENFYAQHESLYKTATERLDCLLNQLNTDWFESFFGEKLQDPLIIVSLCNGRSNYALVSLPDKDHKYGIVIGSTSDGDDLPVYGNMLLYTIIHEFNHNFTNKRFDHIWKRIEPSAQRIYRNVEEQMYNLAYNNPRTVLLEWMNNLFTLMYFKENPMRIPANGFLLKVQQERGFIWMDRSVTFMNHFYNNRDVYADIDDFIPQFVDFIDYISDHMNQVVEEYENRNPYVTETVPSRGSTISLNTDSIEIRFSEPMRESHAMSKLDNEQIEFLPYKEMPSWKDGCTFIIPIDKSKIEHGKTYGFKLPSMAFQSEKFYSIKEDYQYTITIR